MVHWLPLTAKEIQFSCNRQENLKAMILIFPADFKEEKVTVKAALKTILSAVNEITIWIKKKPDDEILPTKDDMLNGKPSKPRSKERINKY